MRAGLGIGRGLAASAMATLRKSSAPGRGREEGAGADRKFREDGPKERGAAGRGQELSRVTGKWDSRYRMGNQVGGRNRTR